MSEEVDKMASVLLRDQSNNVLFTTVGYLRDQGSTFPVITQPSRVVKYTASNPAGIELTLNTSTPTNPGTGQWGYSNGYVYLGDALQEGETVLALFGSARVLEGVNTLAGTSYFDVGKSDPNYRTKIQKLSLTWVGAAEELQDVTISTEDLLSNTGSSTSHYSLAADNNNSPGEWKSTLTSADIPALSAVKDWQTIYFWIKCEKPQGAPTGLFSDVQLKIEGMRYKYARNTIVFSGTSFEVELPFNHYYLYIYALYEYGGYNRKFFIPALRWDSSQQKVYLIGGSDESVSLAKLHYVVHPIDPSIVTITNFTNVGSITLPTSSSVVYRTYTIVFTTTNTFAKCFSTSSNVITLSPSSSGMILYWDSVQAPGWDYTKAGERVFTFTGSASTYSTTYPPNNLLAIYASFGSASNNIYFPHVNTWGSSTLCINRVNTSMSTTSRFRCLEITM
ncbi:MAG: hypothetical protein QXR93_06370 [Archaeoglobaceae archaeon]